MEKRGQLQLSFGMIFSLIIIAAVFAVAGYYIFQFLKFRDCTQVSLSFDELQTKIDQAYNSQGAAFNASFDFPNVAQAVCFGSLTQPSISADKAKQDALKRSYGSSTGNVFIYPYPSKCERKYTSTTLKHVAVQDFFCVPNSGGRVRLRLTFDVFGSGVTISR